MAPSMTRIRLLSKCSRLGFVCGPGLLEEIEVPPPPPAATVEEIDEYLDGVEEEQQEVLDALEPEQKEAALAFRVVFIDGFCFG